MGTIYGYARVSTKTQAKDGNSLECQIAELKEKGATKIFSDVYTGGTTDRPQLELLLKSLKPGDTLMATKLDRLARSSVEGSLLVQRLQANDISIHVLNIGLMDDSPMGRLITQILFSFAEFERTQIRERCMQGKAAAREKPGYREGRPNKYTKAQLDHAMVLLKDYSYTQVADMTGISRATLARTKAERRVV